MPTYLEKKSNIYEKAYNFALHIITAYTQLYHQKNERVLSKQLLRSGTSIGANIAEAHGAISKNDFSSKLSIAYKECLETKYWLSLLKDSGFLEKNDFEKLYALADEVGKILFTSIKTSKQHSDER